MILKEGEENSMLFARLWITKAIPQCMYTWFSFSAACWVTWFGRSWGGGQRRMRSILPGWVRPMQLLAWAQAAATCGSQHSCLVEGQKPCRWGGGRPVGQPIHSGMGWKNTWFHSVDPPQKVKECASWQQPHGLGFPVPMVLLTETQRIPPSFRTYSPKPTQDSFCSNWVDAGQQGHLARLELAWGLSGRDRLRGSKQDAFRSCDSLHVAWLLPHPLQGLWPSFSSSSHEIPTTCLCPWSPPVILSPDIGIFRVNTTTYQTGAQSLPFGDPWGPSHGLGPTVSQEVGPHRLVMFYLW